jgi:hypothetical protein
LKKITCKYLLYIFKSGGRLSGAKVEDAKGELDRRNHSLMTHFVLEPAASGGLCISQNSVESFPPIPNSRPNRRVQSYRFQTASHQNQNSFATRDRAAQIYADRE